MLFFANIVGEFDLNKKKMNCDMHAPKVTHIDVAKLL